ncbi:MAG: MFS transporter [Bacteroidales bacterium]|nr:MFS transporter [Bacteroidales bacterium]
MTLRSLTYSSLIAFLPIYLKERHIPLVTSSRILSFILFTGSIGRLVSGFFPGIAKACLLATFSVTLTTAHKVIRNNALASALTLGFGQGIGGLGVGILGIVADTAGFNVTIYNLTALPLLASLLSIKLKNID